MGKSTSDNELNPWKIFIAYEEETADLEPYLKIDCCWWQDNLRCGAEFLSVPLVGDSTRDENILNVIPFSQYTVTV